MLARPFKAGLSDDRHLASRQRRNNICTAFHVIHSVARRGSISMELSNPALKGRANLKSTLRVESNFFITTKTTLIHPSRFKGPTPHFLAHSQYDQGGPS